MSNEDDGALDDTYYDPDVMSERTAHTVIHKLRQQVVRLCSERREAEKLRFEQLKEGQDTIFKKLHGVESTVNKMGIDITKVVANQNVIQEVLFGLQQKPEDGVTYRLRQIEERARAQIHSENDATKRSKKWLWAILLTVTGATLKYIIGLFTK